MKKITAIIAISLIVFLLMPLCAASSAVSELSQFVLPKPATPNYFYYTPAESEESSDELEMLLRADSSVIALSAEHDRDSDAFDAKYSVREFFLAMQYDVSLDGTDNWQHTSEWDTDYGAGSYSDGYQSVLLGDLLIEGFGFFSFTHHEGNGSTTFMPY